MEENNIFKEADASTDGDDGGGTASPRASNKKRFFGSFWQFPENQSQPAVDEGQKTDTQGVSAEDDPFGVGAATTKKASPASKLKGAGKRIMNSLSLWDDPDQQDDGPKKSADDSATTSSRGGSRFLGNPWGGMMNRDVVEPRPTESEPPTDINALGGYSTDPPDIEKGSGHHTITSGRALDDNESRMPAPMNDGAGVFKFTTKRMFLWALLFVVMVAAIGLGTAYVGTTLALNSYNPEVELPPFPVPVAPTMSPTIDTVPIQPPCDFGDALLEFTIEFDSRPEEVSIDLKDGGNFGTSIWGFDTGAFSSFTQFQRRNVFRVCLVPEATYSFQIGDLRENGLVSQFLETTVYGRWELRYNTELVANYDGDCSVDATQCGEYCECTYTMSMNGKEGAVKLPAPLRRSNVSCQYNVSHYQCLSAAVL